MTKSLQDMDLSDVLPLFQEMLDHVAAVTLSILHYAKKYDLPLNGGLGFHLARLESILYEMGHPLSHSPVETSTRRLVPAEPIRQQGITAEELVLHELTDSGREENGDHVYSAWGINGTLYRFLVCKHNPPHSAKRDFTGNQAKRRLDRPSKTAVLPWWLFVEPFTLRLLFYAAKL